MAKTIRFLGMDLPVVDDEMIDEQLKRPDQPQYYIVTPAAGTDMSGASPQLLARRQRTLCEICGDICWLDPKGFEEVAILKPTIICAPCMIKKVQEQRGDNTRPVPTFPKVTAQEARNLSPE